MQFTDQLNHVVTLPRVPRRIISLVPSQTELLFDLNLDDEIVGVTRFCVHPADKCKQKTIVGGTKRFNFDVIERLQPDLILGNKEENYEEGIERLRERYPVWMSDIVSLEDAYHMMETIGAMLERQDEAERLVQRIQSGISNLPHWPQLRVAYLIWRKPYMAVGHQTFAQEMLRLCGFTNVFGHLPRYPEVTVDQIRAANPDLLLLPSEPFPFAEKHVEAFRKLLPGIRAILVDGEMFTWYGSRLLRVPAYFNALRDRLQTVEIQG